MKTTTASFLAALEQASQQVSSQPEIQYVESRIDEKTYHFHFVHKGHQDYANVRSYRKTILERMGLVENTPSIQIIGDSARFGEDRIDFAKKFLFDTLSKHPDHSILYGMTGRSGDVNALVNEWIEEDPTRQTRIIGNAVSIHTPMAIKSWGCDVGNINHVVIVYPDALFGDDVSLSDNFVPQYDHSAGLSIGICLEGGVQSFLQTVNLLHLNIPVFAVEQLRGPNNAACKIGDNYPLFFSAAEFLSLIKNHMIEARRNGQEVTQKNIESIRAAYLYNPTIHGAYDYETHKHLHIFANPKRDDYSTKMDLFVQAFDKFFKNRIWEKLDLLNVVNCEEALKKQAQFSSKETMSAQPEISDLHQYVKRLPKAELHVHLDGTLEAELMFAMAQRNEVPFPYKSIEETRAAYQFNNLSEFLALYFLGASVMRAEQDFYDLTYAYLIRAHEDGVCHSEMFVGPQTHTWKENVTTDMIMDGTVRAIKDAKEKLGITASIIIDFNRSYVQDVALIAKPGWSKQAAKDAPEDATKTYHSIQDYLTRNTENKKYLVAFGLDYAEVGFPPVWFKALFAQIRADGYKTVAHAGEEGSAEYIRQARVDLGVSRIDHGNHAIDDPLVMQDIIEHEVPLTMCPLSNKALCVVKNLQDHPLKVMLSQNVKVTVNSDDPAYFGGYILQNFEAITEALHLERHELYQLAKNSIEASFLTHDEKQVLINKLDAFHTVWTAAYTRAGSPTQRFFQPAAVEDVGAVGEVVMTHHAEK